MLHSDLLSIDLQLFADGAAAGGAGVNGSVAASADVNSSSTGEGVPAIEGQNQSIDRGAEFEEMIKGDYKEAFDQRVQQIVQKRVKSKNAEVAKYKQLAPALELLGQKYGVQAGDFEGLTRAIQADDSYYEDMALEKGWSVDDAKQFVQTQRERDSLRQQIQDYQTDQQYQVWMQQAEETKAMYPGFSLETEMENPTFRSLLSSGIDVKTAFTVLHQDEIVPAAMQYTATQVKQAVANDIRARGNRVAENGLGNQSGVAMHTDPSKMTKAERQRYADAARNGERITFRD